MNIFVVVHFEDYSDEGKKHGKVQNYTRRALLGLKDKKITVPSIPDQVNSRLGWEAIHPIFFALIKNPKEYVVGNKKIRANKAVGAVVSYYYAWRRDKLQETVEVLYRQLSDISRGWAKWKTIEIYTANKV